MPNTGSWSANSSATGRSSARVLVTCGVMSGNSTSDITRTSSPPRIGSGYAATGWSTQSELLPGAFVLVGGLGWGLVVGVGGGWGGVFDRRRGVGSVPSIQMYSAL